LLGLQICTDSLQVLSDSSGETFPSSSDGTRTYDVGNIKFEEEEEEMNVKTEKVIDSEEEECMYIKEEDCMYCEKEEEDEDLDIQGELNMDINEEVS